MRNTRRQVGGSITGPGLSIGLSIRWTILVFCCYVSSDCALRPIPHDLATYVNRDIYGIAALERAALSRYVTQTGANYISDQALRASLNTEIIPVYRRFTVLAGKIKPQTSDVKMLHATYRDAAAARLRGFQTILLAIDTQDPDVLRQANRMLDRGQLMAKRWQENMAAMAEKHGLNIK